MKIYTRTGDQGQTGLLGGQRVSKDHLRIAAYGTIDELNSHLGLLHDLAPSIAERIRGIQHTLFAIGSRLASASDADAERFHVPDLADADVLALEQAMDRMDTHLPPMRNFILPGGHPAISQAHICRTVCRRAERTVVALAANEQVPAIIGRYLNRLSDLLFVQARDLHRELGIPETPWKR